MRLSLQVQIHKFSTYEYVPIYFRATGSSHGLGGGDGILADMDSARTGILAEIVIAAVVVSIVTVITAFW